MIYYVKGNLFNAPSSQLLVHACNCRGVWGSGIAAQFRKLFPDEYMLYEHYCYHTNSNRMVGTSLILNQVGCLFTSQDYGAQVDKPNHILYHTEMAMIDLLSKTTMDIAMPKINSGLFNVPWEETEKVLNLHFFKDRAIYVYTGE